MSAHWFEIKCSECHRALKVKESAGGATRQCPACRSQIRVQLSIIEKPSWIRVDVAGITHDGRQEILRRIPSPSGGALVREPHNPHDPHAVAMFVTGRKIGYVPKIYAPEVAAVLDAQPATWLYYISYLRVRMWTPEDLDSPIWLAEVTIEPRRPNPIYESREHLPRT